MTQTDHRPDRSLLAALNAENSRAKIKNVREDSSAASSDWRAWFDGTTWDHAPKKRSILSVS
jgi:hypothetical protein